MLLSPLVVCVLLTALYLVTKMPAPTGQAPGKTVSAGTQQRSPKQKLKPDLPDRHEEPQHGQWSGQDFVKTNAVSIINASPPRREEPQLWTQKADFGKVPEYLIQAQKEQSRQQAEREAAETLRLQQVGHLEHTLQRCQGISCLGLHSAMQL